MTDDKTLAKKFKIPKEVNVYVIKDERKRRWIQANWAWRNIYTYDKSNRISYLPPVAFPWAIEKWIIPKDWRNSEYKQIKSKFDDTCLYGYQKESIDKMQEYLNLWWKWFFIRSGTATWKSFIICGIIDRLKSKTLVVAPKLIINSQLKDDLNNYFDNVMITGKDIKKNLPELLTADVLVITHIALNLYFDELNNAWFDTLLLDEWHYCPTTRTDQFNKWKWRNIVWLSANRQRKDVAKEHFSKLYWGYYNTNQEATPVKAIVYRYKYNYSIEEYIKAQEWYAPDSPEINRRLLINNSDRAAKLVDIIKVVSKRFNKIIIFVDRTDLLDILTWLFPDAYTMRWWKDNVWIKNELLWKKKYLLISMEQVVREGMNIPWLELWVLFFSSSEINTVQQLAWRVRRIVDWKEYWYLLDFVDTISLEWSKTKVLWYYNRKKIYKSLDFKEEKYEEFFREDIIEVANQGNKKINE